MVLKKALAKGKYLQLPSGCDVMGVYLDGSDVPYIVYADNGGKLVKLQFKLVHVGDDLPKGIDGVEALVLKNGEPVYFYVEKA